MKNYLLLVKTLFNQEFKVGKSKKKKSAVIGMIFAIILLSVIYLPMILTALISVSKVVGDAGIVKEFVAVVLGMVQIIAIIFGSIMMMSNMFFSKDNEFLLQLPIKSSVVFLAKFTLVFINQFLLAGIIGTVALIIFAVTASMPFYFYLLIIPAIMLSIILGLLVSSIIMIPLMKVVSYFKGKAVVSGVLLTILFVAIMAVYMQFVMGLTGGMVSGSNAELIANTFKGMSSIFIFNFPLAELFVGKNIFVNILIVLAVHSIGGFIAYKSSYLLYNSVVSQQLESNEGKIKEGKFKSNSIIVALVKRDLSEILRFPALFFQCFSQVLVTPMLMYFTTSMMFGSMENTSMNLAAISVVIFYEIMFVCGMNYAATTAISRENYNFYYMKTLPVSYKTQILAKVVIGAIFSATTILLNFVVVMLNGIDLVNAVLISLFTLILSLGFVAWQVKLDMIKPKLNWDNIAQGVKNGYSVMVTMFSSMGVGIVVVGLFALQIILGDIVGAVTAAVLFWTVMFIIVGIFAALMIASLRKNSVRLLDEIES